MRDQFLRIPPEVFTFFTNPGGHSLIIRGNAGAGKTTFALQIIEDLAAVDKSYYFPTRVSDTSLFTQFPWLKQKMTELRLPPSKPPAVKINGSEKEVEIHREGLATLKGISPARTSVTKGSMHVAIGKDLAEIELIYEVIEDRLPERTLLVIDSLDALAERNGLGCVKLLTSMQKDLVEGYGANVVYVLESPEPMLDYLGDGVIKVALSEHHGRRVREMEILKLRGTEIQQPKYLCTLKGGKLRSFSHNWEREITPSRAWSPIPDREGKLSTGVKDLDTLLMGGLERGTVAMVELGSGVPMSLAGTLELALVANFLSQGRGVIWMPMRKTSADTACGRLAPMVTKERMERFLRIPEMAKGIGSSYGQCVMPIEGTHAGSDLKWQNVSYSLQGAAQPYLSLIGFDTLESIYGTAVMEQLIDHLAAMRRNMSVFVGLLSPSSASAPRLADLATVCLRIERIGGTVVLYGEEPFTECNAMALQEQDLGGSICLTPIV